MSQNLISLNFTDEQLTAVDAALAAIESNFATLMSLQPAQRRGLYKMGEKGVRFIFPLTRALFGDGRVDGRSPRGR